VRHRVEHQRPLPTHNRRWTLGTTSRYAAVATSEGGSTKFTTTITMQLKIVQQHASSKYLASISASELSNSLQNPDLAAPFTHIGTAQLQALRQLSDIFSAALPSGTSQHAPPVAQTSSQFRSTVPPVHIPEVSLRMQAPPVPATPIQSPRLARYPSQRVSPIQAPSLSLRVTHKLPITSVIPLTPHPAEESAPYVPQGMAGMNLFETFEEEQMETPALPRHTTRSRAHQHSSNQAHFLAPRIFRPIAFTNNQSVDVEPTQAPNHIPMANDVINQDTGSSLEYFHLIQDETTLPVWNKSAAN
jgi:hypothetical protein